MPNASGAIDLSSLSDEEKAAVEGLAEQNTNSEPEPEARDILTMFLVIVNLDGNPEVMAVSDPRFSLHAPLSRDHIYGAAATIMKDRLAEESALATAEIMQQQAQALMQQQQDAMLQRQVAANLKTGVH